MRFALRAAAALTLLASAASHAADKGPIEVLTNGKNVAAGAHWDLPMGKAYNKVALFSQYPELINVYNRSGAPLTIQSVTLELEPGVKAEELQLREADMKLSPWKNEPVELEPDKGMSFNVFFYPVESSQRKGTVTITYGEGETFTFTISGKGRDSAKFWGEHEVAVEKIFGGPGTDEMVTGLVSDAEGNLYFSGHVTQVHDKFAFDLFYGKVTPDGELAWAKLWAGPFRDYTPDPGQNGEMGGSADAIGIDSEGFVYLVGAASPGKSNNNYACLVMKIDPATGEPVWEKLWRPSWADLNLVKYNAQGYGLVVDGDTVFVTGETGIGGGVFVVALSTADGSVKMQRALDPSPTYTDRGYTLAADGQGGLFVGGLAAKVPVLIRMDVSDLADPKVEWVETIETGWGSNTGSMDIGPEGDVYLAFDRRGASTHFSFGRVAKETGDLVWFKTYGPGRGKNDNCNVIRVADDVVYVGGRVGMGWYDSQFGDALLVQVKRADGAPVWDAFHYNGKGPEEMTEHRVKGIEPVGDALWVLGQAYTGNMNGVRYSGYWYEFEDKIKDELKKIKTKKIELKDDGFTELSEGAVKDASGARELLDLKPLLVWQDAVAKKDGSPPDGELILWKLVPKK